MIREEIDEELRRRTAESEAMSEALLALDESPTRCLLAQTRLSGRTALRWAEAQAAILRLWECFSAYRSTLEHAREVRDRRSRPGTAELADLTSLLSGPAVPLGAHAVPLSRRTLTGPATTQERLTLAALVARMDADFTVATQVIAAVEDAWSAALPRLDAVDAAIRAATTFAGDLGELDTDPFSASSAAVRQQVLTDPLAGSAGGIDQLAREVETWRTDLQRAVRLRDGFAEHVARLHSDVLRLAAAETATADPAAETATDAAPTGWHRAPALARRVAALTGRDGRWQATLSECRGIERDLSAAMRAAEARNAEAEAARATRAELRGRLGAYRAKAARFGHADNAALDLMFREARDLLRATPCDLVAADAAVVSYQRAVTDASAVPSRGETSS